MPSSQASNIACASNYAHVLNTGMCAFFERIVPLFVSSVCKHEYCLCTENTLAEFVKLCKIFLAFYNVYPLRLIIAACWSDICRLKYLIHIRLCYFSVLKFANGVSFLCKFKKTHNKHSLFNSNALGKISRLIHIKSLAYRNVV